MPAIYGNLVVVGLAGGAGCAARAIVRDLLLRRRIPAWQAIVAINLLGAAAAGVVYGMPWELEPRHMLALLGVLAGWTTSSAFSVDVVLLWCGGKRAHAAACWLATMAGAPAAAFLAYAATVLMLGGPR